MLRGESIEALSRELGVESYRLQEWHDGALAGLDCGLRERGGDPLKDQPQKGSRDGGRADDDERALPGADPEEREPPFRPEEVAAMTLSISPGTSGSYGVQRVLVVFGVARLSFYAWRADDAREGPRKPGEKRGPKVRLTDVGLLLEIRDDLATSPFKGEGHQKVWARLRVRRDVHVSRKRILRLMRENHLLSPHRLPTAPPTTHDGKIITDAPNDTWGTDGTRIFTVTDGWVWLFSVVEHWNSECLGWHVCKKGHRFNVLQPVAMAIQDVFGTVCRDAARGIALRMDHGSQYLSDHFLNQIRFWGLAASFAFVAEPETNGVAERFNRTLKEQAIYGRIFNDIEEVRAAVKTFIETYNEHWRIEKLGFLSPREARRTWHAREAA